MKKMDKNVYEVVYHAWFKAKDGRKFLLSLSQKQAKRFAGKEAQIVMLWCIYHIGHVFVIGSNLEVYPELRPI